MFQYVERSKMSSQSRTMSLTLLLVLVSVVAGDVNSTAAGGGGGSRMAWMKGLLDHHDWAALLDNSSLPAACAADLRVYLHALNEGQAWASKMFDASGQYTANMMFGNEYWLGSAHACRDLQLPQYYRHVPPFAAAFYVARVNLTMDEHHLPMSRIVAIGECVPASCDTGAVSALLGAAAAAAGRRAAAAGLPAQVRPLQVRPVPGPYRVFQDGKTHLIGAVCLMMFLLMLTASIYEGCLERRYRRSGGHGDLELSHQKPSLNNNEAAGGKRPPLDKDKDLRRETCGVWSELLLSFSVLSNGRTILSTQRPSDGALTSLHGMRFLSVAWVIMVHTYLAVFYIADNKTMRTVIERNFLYQSVGNASYCVDTFFFISGLLVTVLFLRTEEKKATHKLDKEKKLQQNGFANSALSVSVISQNSFSQDFLEKPRESFYSLEELTKMGKSFCVMFFYRVLRLTPAYGFVIGITEVSIRYAVNQSVFEPAIFDHVTCGQYWWRNLLYINNLYPQREMCMVWSWYMANDTQFYVVGIILLLLSVKYPKFSMVSLGVVMVTSWMTTVYISVWHQYKARIQEPFEMFDPLYDKPWSRIGPYLVGMMVGWYLHSTKCQVKIPCWLVALGWPASVAIIGSLIFGMVDGYFEVWPTAFYVSIGHTAWGVALAWVSIACCCGYGGLVNSALSYRGLLPLSRLTYCAYLVHPTVMMYTTFLMDGPLHLENSMVLIIYAGYAVMAFLASFAISLAFEAPVVRLLKIINNGGVKKEQ
ncbi:nose resistant to fluoxetine protein 6 [Plutella xylostella]|uniref:nose resistant to fluoxetine protein 6 n=1 Tax=Plutella xylostella TaxID=51655 RepID=UPI002032FA8E|nr:nose resistant to fluoxetine protein 6 [Plutella xylostella]